MKKENKETKTYRFEKKVIEHAENNPLILSFAEWCCDIYRQEFMGVETLTKKMQAHFDIGNDCKIMVTKLKKQLAKESCLNGFDSREISWLKTEASKRIKNGTFEGIYKYFVNTYDKPNINRRQFKLLIEKLSGKKLLQK